ncbi:hypothetical protein [Pollutimonas bauzanensis]|uniref:hypothetical protein n=1 Tax=Pollutimonas bauzanensis TaxID=658167 RepID=UPI0015B40C69|nr:hypothetical protein [Pollutimonas bauzanensis]
MKFLSGLALILLLLSACAGRPGHDGSSASSSSGVQVYGTIDTGVGVQGISR